MLWMCVCARDLDVCDGCEFARGKEVVNGEVALPRHLTSWKFTGVSE